MNCPHCGHKADRHERWEDSEMRMEYGCQDCTCSWMPAEIELHHARKALEEYHDLHEGFMVALCQQLGLEYEESITADVVDAVKALKAERQWIPFSKKFPEARRVGLLSDGDDEYALGRWNEAVDRWDILFSDHQFRREFFTHWQPLPELPKEQS